MRTRSAILASLASAAILLIGWQAGNQPAILASQTAASSPPATGSPSTTMNPPAAGPPDASAPAASAVPAPPAIVKDGAFAGSQIRTPYGTIQVKAEISGGKITDVVPVQMTDVGSTSVEIDRQSVPILRSEVLASQSAQVDAVSGATYTTDGYLTSLQAALDAAQFKG